MEKLAAFFESWTHYELSPVASHLAPASRRAKYRAGRHFAAWMRKSHPDVLKPRDVTRSMAEEYLASFRSGRSPVTCNLRICTLREIFRYILEGGDAQAANPWNRVRLCARDGYTRRELSLEEVRRLLVASESCGREWRMLFSIAIYTGLRLGDCCCLTWDAVNLASSIIQIVPRKTRRYLAGRPVTIPLHPELAALLGEMPLKSRSGFVLRSIAHDFTTRRWAVSRKLDSIFHKAGIATSVMLEGRSRRTPSATFHSLRHTFVSIAANAGVPLATVQSIVGHTSVAMTRHYYHPSEDALRQAVNAIPPIMTGAKPPRHAAPSSSRFCSRLKEIEKAKSRGLITGEEFHTLRSRILAEF
jgi:integrase